MTIEKIEAPAHLIDGKYMKDRKSRLVPVEMVPPHDVEMDAFVRSNITAARALQQTMIAFKQQVFGDCHAFMALLDERYNVKRGGEKGNVSFTSYDGTLQISLSVSDAIAFGPEIQSAKSLIDECINDWSEGANEKLRAIVNDAFEVDKEGKLNMGRILSLRRIDIQDERWEQAMKAIADSIIVTGTKPYLNFRERDVNGKFQHIALDMAAL